jgi:hypothetical protein
LQLGQYNTQIFFRGGPFAWDQDNSGDFLFDGNLSFLWIYQYISIIPFILNIDIG